MQALVEVGWTKMFAESRCWTEELLFVLIGIARMVDSATKHLVSRVRQSLDVHKNKRICQEIEWIRGEHMKTIWKRTVQSTISGNMPMWTVFEEFGNMINISPCQDGGGRYQAPRGEATIFCLHLSILELTFSLESESQEKGCRNGMQLNGFSERMWF